MLRRRPVVLFLLVAFYFFPCTGTPAEDSVGTTSTYYQEEKLVYVYPGQAKSERDLPTCHKNAICNIVHKRLWYPKKIEKLCRCTDTDECSTKFTSQPDNYSMFLDNRSQLKFCDDISSLPNCLDNNTLLHVEQKSHHKEIEINSEATCYCPQHTTWKLHEHTYTNNNGSALTVNKYRCAKLEKCKVNDFCGYIRSDTFSSYYHCSCPEGYLCLHRQQDKLNVSLPLYNGEAFKSYCTQFTPSTYTIVKPTPRITTT